MRIYKIERTDQHDYDEYDSFVVIAENEKDARSFHPQGDKVSGVRTTYCGWPFDKLTVEDIGQANEGATAGVVLASFNAG